MDVAALLLRTTDVAAAPDPSLIPAFPSAAAQSSARTFAGTALALHGLAVMVFVGRMWSRCFPVYRMLVDDYICAVAYVRNASFPLKRPFTTPSHSFQDERFINFTVLIFGDW